MPSTRSITCEPAIHLGNFILSLSVRGNATVPVRQEHVDLARNSFADMERTDPERFKSKVLAIALRQSGWDLRTMEIEQVHDIIDDPGLNGQGEAPE